MDSNRVNFKLWFLEWKEKSQKGSRMNWKCIAVSKDNHWDLKRRLGDVFLSCEDRATYLLLLTLVGLCLQPHTRQVWTRGWLVFTVTPEQCLLPVGCSHSDSVALSLLRIRKKKKNNGTRDSDFYHGSVENLTVSDLLTLPIHFPS